MDMNDLDRGGAHIFSCRFPNKLIRNHLRAYEIMRVDSHFTAEYQFKHHELDKVTGTPHYTHTHLELDRDATVKLIGICQAKKFFAF